MSKKYITLWEMSYSLAGEELFGLRDPVLTVSLTRCGKEMSFNWEVEGQEVINGRVEYIEYSEWDATELDEPCEAELPSAVSFPKLRTLLALRKFAGVTYEAVAAGTQLASDNFEALKLNSEDFVATLGTLGCPREVSVFGHHQINIQLLPSCSPATVKEVEDWRTFCKAAATWMCKEEEGVHIIIEKDVLPEKRASAIALLEGSITELVRYVQVTQNPEAPIIFVCVDGDKGKRVLTHGLRQESYPSVSAAVLDALLGG